MNKKRISKALTELQEKYKNKLTFSHSHPRLIEINLKNINKGYGINFVAKKLKIKQENIAAIGDSNNDLPSFTAAALKISVKTKSSLLRESATYYLDYKRNAVANAINEYILSGTDAEIKLVASDLDGTLLRNGTKKIDLVTKETIEKLIDKYNKTFVVCTGRSIDDTLIVANYFKVRNHKNLFAICVNGGCIYDVANKRYLFEKVMDPSKAQQVIDIFHTFQNDMTRQKQMAIEAFVDYDNDSLIKNKKQIHYLLNKEFIYNYYLSRHPGMLKNFWAPREHKPIDSNMPLNRIMKFIMHFESLEDKARMAATMEKYKYDYEISSSSKHNIEIMPLNVSKGKALERLCHYLNINIKETMPIGDEKNDISMLSLSPHSVTFQSSSESVRQSAGHVLNDETSVIVAKAIETYVFKE
jgi:Cof subfamily protein (haloacid dehalogenase superfamily)